MAGPVHAPDALARFQDGEVRLVYARHIARPDGPLFHLVDGRARDLRQFTRRELECFMPDCADRRFTTVSRRSRRDGFRHFTGAGGHTPESLFHQQGKALILRWVTDHHPDITAAAETSTDDRTRRADVMLTWPDGHRIAVEVQYAALPAADWQARHSSYLEQGITPLWLLGHLANPHLPAVPHLPVVPLPPTGRPPEVRFTELHRAMHQAGVQPLWINPILEQVGTSWVTRSPTADLHNPGPTKTDREYRVRPDGSSTTGLFAADPLTACTLTPAGLTTPTTRAVALAETEYRTARARAVAHDRAAAAAAADRERRTTEARRRQAEELAREHAVLRRVWLASAVHADMTANGQTIPRFVQATSPDDRTIHADPAHWRAVLYRDLIQAGDPDVPVTFQQCLRVLADHQLGLPRGPDAARSVVTGFLDSLIRARLLRRPASTAPGATAGFELTADPTPTTPGHGPGHSSGDQAPRTCVRCRYPLADLFPADQDRHLDCDWLPTTSRARRR